MRYLPFFTIMYCKIFYYLGSVIHSKIWKSSIDAGDNAEKSLFRQVIIINIKQLFFKHEKFF